MNGPENPPNGRPDEFETISRLLVPLTRGDPAAVGLTDDAAVLAIRPGFDLVISQDAMVAGVHFPIDMPMGQIARRLLRAALSDLAAKAAEPFGYLLSLAWPPGAGWPERESFAAGLALDGEAFGVALLGGDTVTTPGPFTASATVLGWVPAGTMVFRAGARAGDLLVVSGTIGDGYLGLLAQTGQIESNPHFLRRFQVPEPRFDLRRAIQDHAGASADVSDGLLADAGQLAQASGLCVVVELDRLPLSAPAAAWLATQDDRSLGLAALARGGDDYEIIMAVPPNALPAMLDAGDVAVIGRFEAGSTAVVTQLDGKAVAIGRLGWRHDG